MKEGEGTTFALKIAEHTLEKAVTATDQRDTENRSETRRVET